MKKIFELIDAFNSQVNHLASRDHFPSIPLIGLSIASWITTFMGMWSYTNWPIAILASAGIQLLMLYGAVRFSTLLDKTDTKAFGLLVMFFSALSVSSFFSFAAFHEVVEPPTRREQEADTLLRSAWSRVFNKIVLQSTGEFDNKLKQAGGGQSYLGWVAQASELRSGAQAFFQNAYSEVSTRLTNLNQNPLLISVALLRENQAQIARQRSELQNKSQELHQKIAAAEARSERSEELAKVELKDGGTGTAPNGRATKAGRGEIYRQHVADFESAKLEIVSLKTDLARVQAQLNGLNDRAKEVGADLAASGNSEELLRQKMGLEAAKLPLEELRTQLAKMPIPPSAPSSATVEAMVDQKTAVEHTSAACQVVKTQLGTAGEAVRAAGMADHFTANLSRLFANGCSNPPLIGDGLSMPSYVDRVTRFVSLCEPNKLPAPETSPDKAERNPQDAIRSTTVNVREAEDRYKRHFTVLRDHFLMCMGLVPAFGSNDARDKITDEIRNLIQTYNPEAHPFTRAVAAFQRGDFTAYFAAFVAIVIDALILLTGLAMHRTTPSGQVDAAKYAERQHQQDIDEFASLNGALIVKIRESIRYGSPGFVAVDGEVKEAYIVPIRSSIFIPERVSLREMHNLGLISIEGDSIRVTRQQADFLSKLEEKVRGEGVEHA